MSLRLKKWQSQENLIAEYETFIRQYTTSSCEIIADDKVCNLLLSLPSSYETVCSIIDKSSKITYEEGKNKLFGKKWILFQRNSNSNDTFSTMNREPKC